jgi:transcriptional regulator with XRE-family HTH domain
MITGPQIRAARALLGWSAMQLAERAGLSYPTVQRAESVEGIPPMKTHNLLAIQRALETAGVIFLDEGQNRDGGPGVRLSAPNNPQRR